MTSDTRSIEKLRGHYVEPAGGNFATARWVLARIYASLQLPRHADSGSGVGRVVCVGRAVPDECLGVRVDLPYYPSTDPQSGRPAYSVWEDYG